MRSYPLFSLLLITAAFFSKTIGLFTHFFTRVVWTGSSTFLRSVFKTFAVSLSGTDGRSIRVKKMRFQKYMHSCIRFINWRCGIFNQMKFISLHRSLSLLKKKFRIWLRMPRVLMHSIYFSINCKRFAKIIIINECGICYLH